MGDKRLALSISLIQGQSLRRSLARLTVVVNITAKAVMVDLLKAEPEKLIAITRVEEGYLQSDLPQDNMTVTEGAVEDFTLYEMTHIA